MQQILLTKPSPPGENFCGCPRDTHHKWGTQGVPWTLHCAAVCAAETSSFPGASPPPRLYCIQGIKHSEASSALHSDGSQLSFLLGFFLIGQQETLWYWQQPGYCKPEWKLLSHWAKQPISTRERWLRWKKSLLIKSIMNQSAMKHNLRESREMQPTRTLSLPTE